jgi:hypothetical protein
MDEAGPLYPAYDPLPILVSELATSERSIFAPRIFSLSVAELPLVPDEQDIHPSLRGGKPFYTPVYSLFSDQQESGTVLVIS